MPLMGRTLSRRMLLLIGVSLLALLGMQGTSKKLNKAHSAPLEQPPAPAAEAFVAFITGNWNGQLEPCGCAEKQLGGLDRRTHIFQAIDPNRRLLVDAGPLLQQENLQGRFKLEAFLLSFKKLRYDAVGMPGREILIGRERLGTNTANRPPLVVTNATAESHKAFNTVPFLRKELSWKGKMLTCLTLALTDPTPAGISSDIKLADPLPAIGQTLKDQGITPDGASGATFVVVTLSQINETLMAGLSALPIDVIVTIGTSDEPEWINRPQRPMILTTGKMGKYMIRLDIDPNDQGPEGLAFHRVAIEEEFPRDPAIVNLLDDYQLQLQMENLIEDEQKLSRESLAHDNAFIGNAACAECHEHADIYKKWKDFGHAHAMETLCQSKRQYDPECVACHVVGMLYDTGYRSMDKTPDLAGVGCEMCHGPGLVHKNAPYEEYRVPFTRCEECHNHETSPHFDTQREAYFEKIRHWTEPRKYWK